MKLRKIKSLCTLAVTVTICAGIFAGCGGASEGEKDASKPLVYNIGDIVETIDPALNTSVDGSTIIGNAFEGLMRLDENDKAIPGVAESYEISKDQKTYTFKLRKDAKWSDGKPVTAKDFQYAWLRCLNKDTAAEYAYQMFYIDKAKEYNQGKAKAEEVGIKVIDDNTLEVKLHSVTPYFLGLTAFASYMPLREDVVEGNNTWTEKGETYISNGPFQLKEFKMKDSYEFVKNENYWNKDNIKISGVTYKMVADENTSYATLQNGEFDVIGNVPSEMIKSGTEEGIVQTFPNLGTYFVCINVNNNTDKLNSEVKKALQNKDVRNALALAIDRDSIVTKVTKSGQVPSASFTPAGIQDPSGKDFKKNKFDPMDFKGNKEEAKKLLAKAGYPEGKGLPKFEVLYNSEGDGHRKVMEIIQQNWKEIGVQVELKNQEWAVFLNTRNKGDYQIARHGWSADYIDPMTFLDMWVSGEEGNQASWGNNDAHFNNKEYDELIEKAKTESDQNKRFEYMRKAEDILLDEMPVIPLYDYTKTYGINKNIKGIHASTLGQIYFDRVTIE